MDSFYHDYGSTLGKTSRRKLRAHLLVHELYASYHEFQHSHKAIEETNYRDYLRQKPAISEFGSSINEVDMTSIDDFL